MNMDSSKPPKFILRFLKWFCNPSYHIDIEGDLLEFYERNVQQHGKRKADFLLIKEILLLFRPSMTKTTRLKTQIVRTSLITNYFKVSWRNMMRQRKYSFFNVVGLVFGITSFILISVFVSHEHSFDGFYDNVDNIYHVYEYEHADGAYLESDYYAVTPAQLASALMADYPEVVHATTVAQNHVLLSNENNDHWYEEGLFTDPTFFKLFSHPKFIDGNAGTVLSASQKYCTDSIFSSKNFWR